MWQPPLVGPVEPAPRLPAELGYLISGKNRHLRLAGISDVSPNCRWRASTFAYNHREQRGAIWSSITLPWVAAQHRVLPAELCRP
jgi:hypothetical protein